MIRKRILPIGAAVAVAIAAACSDSTGPGGARSVALITNAIFVDYDTSNYSSEASELEHTLKSFGVQVNPITTYDSASFAAALAVSQALIVPEGFGAMPDSLASNTLALLRYWVDSSGGLLIVNPEPDNRGLLDSLFGYALLDGTDHTAYSLDAAAATGTAFAGGPAVVWDNNGTYVLDVGSLPAGAKAIYTNGTDVQVVVIPEGRGVVVTLGWDWYNAAPHGSQDGGWIEILRRALRES